MLAHCLIDDICLPVFENIYILIIVLLCLFYLCIYFYIFLNSFLVFFEDHIGNKCAIVCFNVSILGKYYIYMYYNVLPNKLTHSLTSVLPSGDYPIHQNP